MGGGGVLSQLEFLDHEKIVFDRNLQIWSLFPLQLGKMAFHLSICQVNMHYFSSPDNSA